MSKIAKASLQKALARKYWSVDDAMYYLTSPQINNSPLVIKHLSTPNEALGWHRDELFTLWCDTDHSEPPRNSNYDSDQYKNEFTVRHFVRWAINKGLRIAWLKWAIAEGHLSQDIKQLPVAFAEYGEGTNTAKLNHKKELSYLKLLSSTLRRLNIDWTTPKANAQIRALVEVDGKKMGFGAVRSIFNDLKKQDEEINTIFDAFQELQDEEIEVILRALRDKIDPPKIRNTSKSNF